MGLTSKKWRILILLSIVPVFSIGCTNQALPSTLKAGETVLSMGEYTSIECIVSNGTDNIRYEWSSSGGNIQGEGKVVDWFAPDSTGDYLIEVDVKGANGRNGTAFITITVKDNHIPAIQYFILSPQNPKYFNGEDILKNQKCDIECVAQDDDGDELAYTWSCDKGEISGTGTIITWTAPSEKCNAYVTIEISDGNGGMATDSITFIVVTSDSVFK